MTRILLVLSFLCKVAWPQVETGTVVIYFLSPTGATVAADSRAYYTHGQKPDDKACKIRALCNKFFYAVAGPVSYAEPGHSYSAYADAKSAWERASRLNMAKSAQKMTDYVAERWVESMKKHLSDPKVMNGVSEELDGGDDVSDALFGATDSAGNIGVTRADIHIDLPAFKKTKKINLTPKIDGRAILGEGGTLGRGDVANDHRTRREAAVRGNHNLTRSAQDAEIAKQLVELTIQIDPHKQELGGDVDELRLDRGIGVTWLHRKCNCKERE